MNTTFIMDYYPLLCQELKDILSDKQIEIGRQAYLLDIFFSNRILLGKAPTMDDIKQIHDKKTYREFINELLDSEDYTGRLEFLPKGMRLMSEANGFRFWFDTHDREMGVRMGTGIYEPETLSTIRALLKEGMVCADIGAQTGFFTLIMAQCIGESGYIYAFEPISRNFELLQKNIRCNHFDTMVKVYNAACSDITGTIRANITSGMLVAGANGTVEIPSIAFDDLGIKNVDFLKIDVEGHEVKVLNGLKSVLANSRPLIVTELNSYWLTQAGTSIPEYIRLMEANGYNVLSIDNNFYPLSDKMGFGDLDNINALAVPIENLDKIKHQLITYEK